MHNEKHCNLYSPKMTWVIKFRMLRLAGHMACMREKISACRVMVGNLQRTVFFYIDVCGMIISE